MLKEDCDVQGHYICLTVTCFNVTLKTVNIYGFNSKAQNDHLLNSLEEKLINWLVKFPDAYLITGGDFNIVLDEIRDRWPPGRPSNVNSTLKSFMERLDVTDTWRDKQG